MPSVTWDPRKSESALPVFVAFLAFPATVVILSLLVVAWMSTTQPELTLPVKWYGTPEFPLFRDFRAYYRAAQFVLRGESPYDWSWYLGTPVFAWMLAPLALMSFAGAVVLFQCVSILSWPIVGAVIASRQPERRRTLLCGAAFLCVSAPFLWAVHRANVDPLAGLLLIGAFVALADARQALAGFCITLAFCVKYYALLLLLPLECLGFRRAANSAYATIVVLFVTFGPLQWLKPFSKLQMDERLGFLMPEYNVSAGHAWWGMAHGLGLVGAALAESTVQVGLLSFFGVTLVASLVADYRRHVANALSPVDELILYTAFLLVVPRQLYPYTAVMTLPFLVVLPRLWRATECVRSRSLLLAIATAVGLQHSHAGTLSLLLKAAKVPLDGVRLLDGFGSLFAIVLVTAWKVHRASRSRTNTDHRSNVSLAT
jgi:hypothetical protein